MVVMTPQASQAEIDAVVGRLEAAGVHAKVMPGELTTAIGAIGDPEGVRAMALEGMAGVDQVIPISRPYKLASSELSHYEPTSFDVDGRRVGGGNTFCLIAGPCTVESRDQTLAVADAVSGRASMMRGGAFKPRTSPWSFKGLGTEALAILREARERTGLPIVSELTDTSYAEQLAEVVDVVQVGARNMQNYALLEVVGKLGKPVLLKRDTHLPVIVDPSHAAGDRRLVAPFSRAAAAVGADGIIVEVADDPEAALCDGPQQLYASDFGRFADAVVGHAALVGKRLA